MEENKSSTSKAGNYSDPTYNVLQLVEASVKRLDDLHKIETKRIDELISTHFSYIEKLNLAEAKRIDAIRAVDVGAVAIASERAAQQAAVLANQVSASAETLRALVASTAATVAQQLQQVSGQLVDRIALLEKSQYETKGSGLPNIMSDRLDVLERNKAESFGKGAGISQFIGWIIAAIAVAAFMIKLYSK